MMAVRFDEGIRDNRVDDGQAISDCVDVEFV